MSTSETLLIVTGTDEVTSGISASEDHVIAWGYLFIVVLLLLVGVFGNSLVVASVIHFRFLQSITNILIATVAGMDILFVLSTVYDIGVIVSPGVWSGWLPCMIIQATACVNAVSNSFLLVAVAGERYISTFFPLRYQEWVTPGRIKLVASICVLIPTAWIGPSSVFEINLWAGSTCRTYEVFPFWVLLCICGTILCNIALMNGVYILILRKALQVSKRINDMTVSSQLDQAKNESGQWRKNMKVLKNMMFIVVLFNVCLVPHMILTLWMGLDPQQYQGLVNVPYEICLTMFFLNSTLNPIVYAIRFQPFKAAFKLIFGCIKSDDRARAITEASM